MTRPSEREFAGEITRILQSWSDNPGPVKAVLKPRTSAADGGTAMEWIVTDRHGRRTAIKDGTDASLAARLVNLHHSEADRRDGGNASLEICAQSIAGDVRNAMSGLGVGKVEVALREMQVGGKASSAHFRVDLQLLDQTLLGRPDVLNLTYQSGQGDGLLAAANRQRRRRALLAGRPRLDALLCCPVVARHAETCADPHAMAARIGAALDGASGDDDARFEEGILVDRVELTPGAWSDDRLGTWWHRGRVTFRQQLPQTLALGIVGRRLGEVVDHELLPADAPVTRVRQQKKRVYIEVDAPPVPFAPIYAGILERAGSARTAN